MLSWAIPILVAARCAARGYPWALEHDSGAKPGRSNDDKRAARSVILTGAPGALNSHFSGVRGDALHRHRASGVPDCQVDRRPGIPGVVPRLEPGGPILVARTTSRWSIKAADDIGPLTPLSRAHPPPGAPAYARGAVAGHLAMGSGWAADGQQKGGKRRTSGVAIGQHKPRPDALLDV